MQAQVQQSSGCSNVLSRRARQSARWLESHSFAGARLTDVTTSATNALFLFPTRAPVAVGASLAYANALASISFKIGSYAEHRIRQRRLLREAAGISQNAVNQLRGTINPIDDIGFYGIALINLLLLCAAPSCNLAAAYNRDNEVLTSPWLYFGLMLMIMLSSFCLESQLDRCGPQRTREVERALERARNQAALPVQELQIARPAAEDVNPPAPG